MKVKDFKKGLEELCNAVNIKAEKKLTPKVVEEWIHSNIRHYDTMVEADFGVKLNRSFVNLVHRDKTEDTSSVIVGLFTFENSLRPTDRESREYVNGLSRMDFWWKFVHKELKEVQ